MRQDSRYRFVCGEYPVDGALVRRLLDEQRPGAIVHFAAESHDALCDSRTLMHLFAPTLREPSSCWKLRGNTGWSCPRSRGGSFVFWTVSTDEVYGKPC